MRASEFELDEGRASRRKQASMNAQRRMANTQKQVAAPAAAAPAVAPDQPLSTASIANPVNPNVKPGGSKEAQAFRAQRQPTAAGTDWDSLSQSTAPAKTKSSYLDRIKKQMSSTGQNIANRFSTQGKISRKTDQIFMDKFLKDLKSAEQTTVGLRGQPFDLSVYVAKYLAKNRWRAGNMQAALNKSIEAKDKPQIAKVMATIGKTNNINIGPGPDSGAMKQIATQLTTPPAAPVPPVPPATPVTVAPPRPSGAPTPEEEAKLQQRIQQQLQRQGKA
jgi:hypothetical protein